MIRRSPGRRTRRPQRIVEAARTETLLRDRTQTLATPSSLVAATTVATTAADCVAVQPFLLVLRRRHRQAGRRRRGRHVAGGADAHVHRVGLQAGLRRVRGRTARRRAHRCRREVPDFESGYTDFSACLPSQTVAACEAWRGRRRRQVLLWGRPHGEARLRQRHGRDGRRRLRRRDRRDAAQRVRLLAAAARGRHLHHGRDLRRVPAAHRRRPVEDRRAAGPAPVCTNPHSCATAVYSPIPSEDVHDSIGHWVEDDPTLGDGAFSSAGAFGFYPWISQDRTTWGVLARFSPTFNGAKGGGVVDVWAADTGGLGEWRSEVGLAWADRRRRCEG